MADTNAVKWLKAQGVDFAVLQYQFTEIGADHAAQAVGRPLEKVCKTLVIEASGKLPTSFACLMPDRRTSAGSYAQPPRLLWAHPPWGERLVKTNQSVFFPVDLAARIA